MSRSARRGTLADAHEARLARLRSAWNSAVLPTVAVGLAAAAAATAGATANAAAAAITASTYAVNFGDGVASQYDIAHTRGTLDIHVSVVRIADGVGIVPTTVTRLDANTVRLNFAAPVALNAYRALVIY